MLISATNGSRFRQSHSCIIVSKYNQWIKEVDSGLFFHLEIEEKSISENKRNLR